MAKTKAAEKAKDVIWQGPDKLRALLVPIGSLTEDPDNLMDDDALALDELVASYRRFGQQKNVVADAAGRGTTSSAPPAGSAGPTSPPGRATWPVWRPNCTRSRTTSTPAAASSTWPAWPT
jgi:hypothetical protein